METPEEKGEVMKLKKFTGYVVFDNKAIPITVLHNLPNQFGLSIECAFDNWVARINDIEEATAKNFCKYTNNKKTGYIVKEKTK